MATTRRTVKKKGGHGMPHGFVSKAQWRMFFARGKTNPKFAKLAHKEAHKTPGGPKVRFRRLPARKGGVTTRTLRKKKR
jgi:hypothetical protein